MVAFIQVKGQGKHPFARLHQECDFLLWLAISSHFGADQGTGNLQDHPNLVLEGLTKSSPKG